MRSRGKTGKKQLHYIMVHTVWTMEFLNLVIYILFHRSYLVNYVSGFGFWTEIYGLELDNNLVLCPYAANSYLKGRPTLHLKTTSTLL